MASTLSPPTQPEFFEDHQWPTERSVGGKLRPVDQKSARFSSNQPSRGRRASRAFARFLITLGIGIGGTLAWQSYGDEARQMIADAYPQQLGRLAPQPSPRSSVAQIAPATVPLAAAASSADPEQVKAMLLGLAAVNQKFDQLATQIAFLQQQMAGEIARRQASEQDILNKIAAPPPRPAAAPARKPVLLTSPAAVPAPPVH